MMKEQQFRLIQQTFVSAKQNSRLYQDKFSQIDDSFLQDEQSFRKLPFTNKDDLRAIYPLGLQAVPEEKIVRIHSSSGTTGTPIIIPYTKQDVDDWALLFRRCYELAGITSRDRIQITPGYGLWTAGIGFQLGAELLGAMTIPTGPGNTDKQIQMMLDLKSTVLCATSSYALLLAEEIARRGIGDRIYLTKGVIGSERWGKKMRERIKNELSIDLFDIYGLTEIYGPGIGISCKYDTGMHYFDDYVYFEIIDPKTLEVLPDGEMGELVITTLRKEGAPLIRYRTHDLTRIIPGECPCGSPYPRIDTIVGRTDDMVKVKGVNIFPGQIDELLSGIYGVSSEYMAVLEHKNGKDSMALNFEVTGEGPSAEELERYVVQRFKTKIGITISAHAVAIGELPRSMKKTKRIYDNRYE